MAELALSNQGFEYIYWGSGSVPPSGTIQLNDLIDYSNDYDYYLDGSGFEFDWRMDSIDTDPDALDGSGDYLWFQKLTVVATKEDAILATNDGNNFYLLSNVRQDFPTSMTIYEGYNSLFVGPLAPCFARGTHIATPNGEWPVERLAIGDLVVTATGVAPVKWLGRQTRHRRFAQRTGFLPVRIQAGALGGGLPHRDLFVSPDHALLVDGLLVHALALVNGLSIVQLSHWDEPELEYFHIELENHDLILAEGAPAETFVDNVTRRCFDNWAEYEALYGESSLVPELPLPRVKNRRQLARCIQQRLMDVARRQCSAVA